MSKYFVFVVLVLWSRTSEATNETGTGFQQLLVPKDLAAHNHSAEQAATEVGDDYTFIPNVGAYKLHLHYFSWNIARQICMSEGAHLAIINSNTERDILVKMLSDKNLTGAWLGIHDIFTERDWTTVFGEYLSSTGFTTWMSNGPNGGTAENCGSLTVQGGLEDLNCFIEYPFFCEMKAATSCLLREISKDE